MITIPSRNVNGAFRQGMALVAKAGRPRPSRDGHTITVPFPVTTHYTHPWERVLFDRRRDANPFFHLFEAMWMLSGSRDARFLDKFVRNFSSRYAEEGGIQHGAYGHRWREHFGFDQIDLIVSILAKDPDSRQCILQMWDPDADLGASVKDKPCNQSVHFRIRERMGLPRLDITVFCRSNDIVMGAYGANYVHMTVMQEYVAAMLGMNMGHYWQVSSDYHAYIRDTDHDKFKRVNWHDPDAADDRYMVRSISRQDGPGAPGVASSSLFLMGAVDTFREEVQEWVAQPDRVPEGAHNRVFEDLLVPMWHLHDRRTTAGDALMNELHAQITHEDWSMAAAEWIGRRRK